MRDNPLSSTVQNLFGGGLEGNPNCVSGDRSGAGKLSVTVGMEVLVPGDRVPMVTLPGGLLLSQ